MKKLTLLLSAVLFSMMSFAATTVTMDFTSKAGLEKLGIAYPVTDAGNGAFCTNFEEGVAFTQEGVSISMDKSGNTVTRVWLTAKGVLDLRHYKNGVLKFTAPDGNIITKIELAGGNVAGFENVTDKVWQGGASRSEEHTSELQSP